MIWNYDHFSKQNVEFGRIYRILNNSYLLKKSKQKSCNLLGEL
jgi:hypothetical protein